MVQTTQDSGRRLDGQASKTEKVTLLVTVEAIVAGFMIAYGALNMQMLTYWAEPEHCASPVSTFIAGLFIYAIVLTCFASIFLLYWSLRADKYDFRYSGGLILCAMAIALSAFYAMLTVVSTYNFTVISNATVTKETCSPHVPQLYTLAEANQWYEAFWCYALGLGLFLAISIFWVERNQIRKCLHLKEDSCSLHVSRTSSSIPLSRCPR